MKIRELFKNKSKWIKGSSADDAAGYAVNPRDPNAVKWCLYGAVEKCYPHDEKLILRKICASISSRRIPIWQRPNAIAVWNDRRDRTFAQVKRLVIKLDI